MLFAAREPGDEFAGLPELVVEGLGDADARALLASVIPGRLDERVVDELLAETRGNPLALFELPRGFRRRSWRAASGCRGRCRCRAGSRRASWQRLEALPEDTQRLLLVAAAEPTGDPALLWRAAERLGITGAALEPAESAGLIRSTAGSAFAIRWCARRSTGGDAERAAAGAPGAGRGDRRAGRPRPARLASRRGGGRPRRGRRRRAGAGGRPRPGAGRPGGRRRLPRARRGADARRLAACSAGAGGGADKYRPARSTTPRAPRYGGDRRASTISSARACDSWRADRVRRARGGDAPGLLLEAARELEAVDPDRARATYLEALDAARFAGPLARGTDCR